MIKYTKKHIIQSIQSIFPNQNQRKILKLLNLYGTEYHESEKERVQLAILKLSNGNIEELQKQIKLAKTDYRDVLSSAEYNLDGSKIDNPYDI